MTNLLLAATNSWMRIDVLIWILAIPVVIVFIIFLFLQIRQHLALKNELVQLNKIKRHSIEYELVIKAMHLAIWRVDIPEGIIYYESDYRGKSDSFKTGDGFRIAEADLKLRGPGDLEGTQQSGMAFDLKIADIARDGQLVQMARDEAQIIIDDDPTCTSERYAILWHRLKELRKTNINWAAIS